jgi:hypothetical protein
LATPATRASAARNFILRIKGRREGGPCLLWKIISQFYVQRQRTSGSIGRHRDVRGKRSENDPTSPRKWLGALASSPDTADDLASLEDDS